MSRIKIGLILLFLILAAIQFVQPARNQRSGPSTAGIATVVDLPDTVQAILQNSCYDCHSNHTPYPWYSRIQPLGWWLDSHIKEGKAELNFDEFASYPKRRQLSKLKAMRGAIEDKSMPLPSYTFIHREAGLSQNDQKVLKDWLETAKDEISIQHARD